MTDVSLRAVGGHSRDQGIHCWRSRGQKGSLDLFSPSVMTLPLLSATHTHHMYYIMSLNRCTCAHGCDTAENAQRATVTPSHCGSAAAHPAACHQSRRFLLRGLEKRLTQEFKCSEEKLEKETELRSAAEDVLLEVYTLQEEMRAAW